MMEVWEVSFRGLHAAFRSISEVARPTSDARFSRICPRKFKTSDLYPNFSVGPRRPRRPRKQRVTCMGSCIHDLIKRWGTIRKMNEMVVGESDSSAIDIGLPGPGDCGQVG